MNNLFKALCHLDQSSNQLLTDESTSLEIKQSATNLKESVQPCLEELKQSATKLKQLAVVCSDKLYQAENVWLSKPRIAEVDKQEIWKELGEASGCFFRIQRLVNQRKSEANEKTKRAFELEIEDLKKTWFIDAKGQRKRGIGWSEKDSFIKTIRYQVQSQSQRMNVIIRESLLSIYQNINAVILAEMQNLLIILDQNQKDELSKRFNFLRNEVEGAFRNPIEHFSDKIKAFNLAIKLDLDDLVNKGWGDIYWEEVVKFKEVVYPTIDSLINLIFDEIVKLATQALEQAIAFYNDFLERQERYQQETPEQREAEKAWIDQQRQQLEQVHDGIEAILKAS